MSFEAPTAPAFLVLGLLLLAACPARSLPEAELRIGEHTLTVEIASTPEERAVGLMHRKSMKEDRGMIFVFENDQILSFWMKDTLIPLSIAFISADGTIRQIEDMEPESLSSVTSRRSVLYALEVNRGWFVERGIVPGDVVDLPPEITGD